MSDLRAVMHYLCPPGRFTSLGFTFFTREDWVLRSAAHDMGPRPVFDRGDALAAAEPCACDGEERDATLLQLCADGLPTQHAEAPPRAAWGSGRVCHAAGGVGL